MNGRYFFMENWKLNISLICRKTFINSLIIAVLLLLQFPQGAYSEGILEVHFIDVGQGDAILIKNPDKAHILIDSGPLSSGYRLNKYLSEKGVTALEAIVITHMHPDHVGGLFCIVPDIAVQKIYDNGAVLSGDDFGEEYINLTRSLNLDRTILTKGDTLSFGSVRMQILSPYKPLTGNMNADSIVIKLSYKKVSFLFTGDLNKKGEKRLLERDFDLRCQVLKVGHHGANDATSEAFLEAVDPVLAVISVGRDNPRGYPGGKTLHLLAKKGIKVYRTDRDCTVVVQTDGEKIWEK